MKKKALMGFTYGDPTSIGPEILTKALNKRKYRFIPYIIGVKSFLKKPKAKNKIFFHSLDGLNFNFTAGHPSKTSGEHSLKCLKEAAKLGLTKKITALITGPVSKEMISKTNTGFYGQTDELAKFCKKNSDELVMLFAANDLRLALFTRHIPLKYVARRLTQKNIENFLVILNKELKKWFKIQTPKIAILGLNPHAGENGLFGKEEQKIILPVIIKLRKTGLKLFGPLSPDATLAKAGQDFLSRKRQKYDVYVSLYHDQGLPMFKAVTGLSGVNVTLGLPFLRVSVDHGTAFDIAGKNKASEKGLISAIELAEKLTCSP